MGHVSRAIRSVVLGSTVALVLVAASCVAPAPRSAPRAVAPPGDLAEPQASPSDLDLAGAVAELVAAHNRVRAAHHRPPLSVSGPLEAAAREHARDMARHRWMSHRGSDLSSPFRRMSAQGYAFRRAGENVAASYRSVDAVMKGWMFSPGHRANILGRYTEVGAACATATNGTPYWCVTFGEPEARE
jgi:uncharacterized protein YkwD